MAIESKEDTDQAEKVKFEAVGLWTLRLRDLLTGRGVSPQVG